MGKINLSQLQKRLLSGFVLGPLVVLVIIYGGWPFAVMVVGFAAIALYEWVQLSLKIKNKIPYLVLGITYVLFCFLCMFFIRITNPLSISLLFIALIWSSDIGAYFIGKKFGGPKLAPKISPNKTWAGFVGAIFAPIAVAAMWVMAVHFYDNAIYVYYMIGYSFIVIAAITGVSGQVGDLIVSFMKRRAGVKDSGSLIPGHGGLLDRLDSLMLAAPFFLAATYIARGITLSIVF
ncbi:MAG: hypothetical protein DHS20C02_06270 [Micavibrio sp.]|nr:MAG: hypothetical protein DHS20C02_06270 [Micavibrio sp.]